VYRCGGCSKKFFHSITIKCQNHMAKKKSKGGRKRRRVGALSPSSPMVKLGSVAVGFLAANQINALVNKVVPASVDAKIVGAGQTGLGALLILSKGRPNIIKTLAGGVLAGSGVKRLAQSMGLMPAPAPAVTGYRSVPVIGSYGQVPVIGSGFTPSGTLAGYAIPSGGKLGRVGSLDARMDGSTLVGNN
jgi:DNA-directed RNA polymerase subunit RPC12/RpoP